MQLHSRAVNHNGAKPHNRTRHMQPRLVLGAPALQHPAQDRRTIARASNSDEEPDWDKEMSIFTQRMMRPNQLATLRELESKVEVGKVLWCKDGLAIIAGINPDAPLGTKLSFISGGTGVLLWHRSDNLAFALVLGGESAIAAGEPVECKIKGVLQVIDEAKGPITRKDYELWQAPAGESLMGRVVSFLGQPHTGLTGDATSSASTTTSAAAVSRPGGRAREPPGAAEAEAAAGGDSSLLGLEATRPLINQQVAMKNRDQISESLFTGVKALDALTPLGRGASLLVIGPNGSGKSQLAVDALLGQVGGDVRAVLAATTMSPQELQQVVQVLEAAGALPNTVIVACDPDASLGRKLATLCAAAAVGERIRDEGGHSLVLLDDGAPLINVWEALVAALGELGQEALRQGLIKDAEGRDITLTPQTEQELVDYEGMLVSGAVAQRRGFFSTLLLRPAKMNKALGSGSMSLVPLLPGRCATGVKAAVNLDMGKYQTLSEEQKAKIKAALEKKAAEAAGAVAPLGPGEVTTEFVEEFISICDGQVVLEPPTATTSSSSPSEPSTSSSSTSSSGRDSSWGSVKYQVNPKLSITRVGSRAYYKALEQLAPQIRLQLAQAEDAAKYATNREDPLLQKYVASSQRIAAALQQDPGHPCSFPDLVALLFALQSGLLDHVPAQQTGAYIAAALQHVHHQAQAALDEVAASKQLTAAAEKGISDALEAYKQQWQKQQQGTAAAAAAAAPATASA